MVESRLCNNEQVAEQVSFLIFCEPIINTNELSLAILLIKPDLVPLSSSPNAASSTSISQSSKSVPVGASTFTSKPWFDKSKDLLNVECKKFNAVVCYQEEA